MASTTEIEAKISIKVIMDKKKNKVVYAEAGHDFVDILFSFMTLPMGTIVRLLGKHADKKFEVLGSLNNVYQSLVDIPECYMSSEECKSMLLNPTSVSYDLCRKLKLEIDDSEPTKYFRCAINCYGEIVSTYDKTKCRSCGKLMNHKCNYGHSSVCVGDSVFLSDIATFTVTDDLCVMPYTSTCSIQLLTDLGITNACNLEERKIDIGREQMIYLLKLALSFNSSLTYLVHHMTNSNRDIVCLRESNFDKLNLIKKEVSASSTMLLEVSLQKSTGKFLFAEATEDFVDFVFGFLAIPLGTLIGTLMNGSSSLICMDNIFKSISNMSVGRYFKSQKLKDILVKPQFGQKHPSKNQLFSLKATVTEPCSYVVFKDPRVEGGLLKRSGVFMVTDDLVITPSSSFLTMEILNKLKVPFNDIEKHEIKIGLEEGLRMLKASLRSLSTLTTSLEHQLKK